MQGSELRKLLTQGYRFLITGGLATLLDLCVFVLLGFLFDADSIRFVLAFTVSVCCRFLADKRFTFHNRNSRYLKQLLLYFLSCGGTMTVGLVVFNLLLYLGCAPFLSKLISIPFVTVSGFFLFRNVVFRN